jgi:hypothetical protein
LYKKEYQTALAKIAVPQAKMSDTLASKLNYITTNGVPVLEISIADSGRTAYLYPQKLVKKVCNDSYMLPSYERMTQNQIIITPNSADARARMKSVASKTGAFAQWEPNSQDTRYVSATYTPFDEYGMERINDMDNDRGLSRNGTTYYMLRKSFIAGTDPRAKQIMLAMRKEHYRNKLALAQRERGYRRR